MMPKKTAVTGRKSKAVAPAAPPVMSFADALATSMPRPTIDGTRNDKKAYAERLSNKIAVLVANKLRDRGQLKGDILPRADGRGRESKVPSGVFNKPKKTDVNFSTFSGLELLVSIKTLNFPDSKEDVSTGTRKIGRYTKNMVRADHEFRAEAMELHERYPYAVLTGLYFLPRDACADGGSADLSSFAHAVMTFRTRGGRLRPDEPSQMFELFYVGIYDHDGPDSGRVSFFDIMDAPPKHGVPKKLVGLENVVSRILETYGLRNGLYIPWEESSSSESDATPILVDPDHLPRVDDDTDDTDDDVADAPA